MVQDMTPIYIRYVDNGNIRKCSRNPFPKATEYRPVDSAMLAAAPVSLPSEEIDRVAAALVNSERAEHGLSPCSLEQLHDVDLEKYRTRAMAALRAIKSALTGTAGVEHG